MNTVTIEDLPNAQNLNDNDIFPISQSLITKSASIGDFRNYIQKNFYIVGEYRYFSRQLSPLELTKNRLLRLEYQIIEIALYQELCSYKWVGETLNATADWWYKCNADGTRNIYGQYMRVEDSRGIFHRCYGANAVKKGANNTPYDGFDIGHYDIDKIRPQSGYFELRSLLNGSTLVSGGIGIVRIEDSPWGSSALPFDPGSQLQKRVYIEFGQGIETKPVSISVLICISY